MAAACEYHNCDFSRLIGNHFHTSRENLMRFGLVIPEFEAKEVVLPESIIVTTVSSPKNVRYRVGLLCVMCLCIFFLSLTMDHVSKIKI